MGIQRARWARVAVATLTFVLLVGQLPVQPTVASSRQPSGESDLPDIDWETARAQPGRRAPTDGQFLEAPQVSADAATVTAAARPRIVESYGNLPLSFELNQGQVDSSVDFLSRGSGYSLFLTPTEHVLALRRPPARLLADGDSLVADQTLDPGGTVAVRMRFVGADPHPTPVALEELPGKVNYFIGDDPARWRTNVATYGKVRYADVYPGIDVVYYGNQRQLEYDVIVAPGADPSLFRLGLADASALRIDTSGDLVLALGTSVLRLRQPRAYQETEGRRHTIAAAYRELGGGEAGFEIGAYDPDLPLVIDPVLAYSTFLGSTGLDSGTAIAVDSAGNIFIGGFTGSTTFPTAGAFQSTFGGPSTDGFVLKLNAAGTALVYSTFLGGSGDDDVRGLAIDASGNAYVTGRTQSTNFPTTVGAFQTKSGGFIDAFVTKLNAAGNALVYSTYFGGADVDEGDAIAVDGSGNAYVTGFTSLTIPTTTGAFQTAPAGGGDAFVFKLNATGSGLVYSTYLGGSPCVPTPPATTCDGDGSDIGRGIAVDASGNAYVAGRTGSPTFPTTTGALQTTHGSCAGCDVSGFFDAFVTKLNPTGSGLVYSTFLGGQRFDEAFGIAVDASGNAYVAGNTASLNFYTTNGFQTSYHLGLDAFLTKLNDKGSGVLYSTYLGGTDHDEGRAVAVSGSGIAYLAGFTVSTDFPTRVAIQPSFGGTPGGSFFGDGFVAKIDTTRAGNASLIYSSYLGGSGLDEINAVAVAASGPVVTGSTTSTNFPTASPFQAANAGGFDAFVARLAERCVSAPTGLVGWWPGDGNANDIVAGDTASAFGGVSFGAGQVAQGFTLNGIDGYVRIPDTAALKPASLTVDFWFKSDVPLDGNVLEAPLLVKLNETDDVQFVSKGYDFLYEFGALRFGLVSTSAGARSNVDFAVTIPAGTWHHVAGTYDATGQKLYFDGQLVATGVNFGPIAYPAGTTNIQLGRDLNTARGPSPFFFKGTIDEVQIASRAFTASEIQAIYSALGTGVCKPSADLSISTLASPDPAAAGALLSYTIAVTNNGPNNATGVTLTDTLPANAVFDSLAGQAACVFDATSQKVTCNIGGMPSGQTLLFTVNVRPTSSAAGSSVTNTTLVLANEPDPNTSNNAASLTTRVLATGQVVAWGTNTFGQIGDGTTTPRLTPVPVSLAGVTRVAAGRGHSLALKFDGTVWAWGLNGQGQLGDGTTTNRLTPVQVSGLSNIVDVAAGGFHSLALKRDGTVVAWGQNDSGQLGDGTTMNRLTPVQVSFALTQTCISPSPLTPHLAAGDLHSLLITSDGTVWAWGQNAFGQLGDGTTTNRLSPVVVTTVSCFLTGISGGSQHSLGVRTDGSVLAWGQNSSGQLGDGTTTSHPTPVQLSATSISSVSTVAAGDSFSLALKSDGTVWTWGFNGGGQLATGDTLQHLAPTPVKDATGAIFGGASAISASAAGNFSLAVKSNGTAWGWGTNTSGTLGDGTTGNIRTSPVQAQGLTGAFAIAAGGQHSLAVLSSTTTVFLTGTARCGNTVLSGGTVELISGSVVIAKTTAGADGSYTFAGLAPNATYSVRYTGTSATTPVFCSTTVTTGASGTFQAPVPDVCPDLSNHIWPKALPLTLTSGVAMQLDRICRPGISNWYKIPNVLPGRKIVLRLEQLPADYTLVLYKDIQKVLNAMQAGSLEGVRLIDAGVAPGDLSSTPGDLSSTPGDLSSTPGDLSSTPGDLSSTPGDLSSTPGDLSSTPGDLSSTPGDLSSTPGDLSSTPAVYSAAVNQALYAFSARSGLTPEAIARNTWDNSGDFYVRVYGSNGVYDLARPYKLTATVIDSSCVGVTLVKSAPTPPTSPGTPKTLFITHSGRLRSPDGTFVSATDAAAFITRLQQFASRLEVAGVVIDLATNTGMAPNYTQWDSAKTCAPAANVVADAVSDLISPYRSASLQYVVIAGGDQVVPYRRVPDLSQTGNEKLWRPPVLDSTVSNAALRDGYVLTDNFYGSARPISRFDHQLYVPDLAVGRLVETIAEMTSVFDAYEAVNGVVTPQKATVTGYDFLADGAGAIAQHLTFGGLTVDSSLIEAQGLGPSDLTAWHADQLRAKLFGATPNTNIVSLNAHFSASLLLAADYQTTLRSEEFATFTDGRFRNTLFLSTGCHSGYNVPKQDAIAGVTRDRDFAQVINGLGSVLVAGTGYQYGGLTAIGYSELLETNFIRELRVGTGPVPVGQALAKVKRDYLAAFSEITAEDEKAIAELTLYGLPMWSVSLPVRMPAAVAPTVIATTPATSQGLSSADLTPAYVLHRNDRTATIDGGGTTIASYFDADGNIQTSPLVPIEPRVVVGVPASGSVARGVVVLRGTYSDVAPFRPLVEIPVTEVRESRPNFITTVFRPGLVATLNSFVSPPSVVFTPFQYISDGLSVSGTGRPWSSVTGRAYFSSRIDPAALAAPPVIYNTLVTQDGTKVRLDVMVGGAADPGLEAVYATFTATKGTLNGKWDSIVLTERSRATGTVGVVIRYVGFIDTAATAADPTDVRLFIQAVGGTGLVSVASNQGAYYRIVNQTVSAAAPKIGTTLTLQAPAPAAYASRIPLSARLADPSGNPVSGKTIKFDLGGTASSATTGLDGTASGSLLVSAEPGSYQVTADFVEDLSFLASSASQPITVTPATATLAPAGSFLAVENSDSVVIATLTAGTVRLHEQPVVIGLGAAGSVGVITDGFGNVLFDTALFGGCLPPGTYPVALSYPGNTFYTSASLSVSVVVRPEKATFALTSPVLQAGAFAQTTGMLALAGKVTQEQDRSLGDLSRAFVTYTFTSALRGVVNARASVGADGTALSTTVTLLDGHYSLQAAVVGDCFASPGVTADILIDGTPPTTTASAAPTPNQPGWNKSDVTVTLSAVDNLEGSGVKQLSYSLNGAQTGPTVVVAGSTTSFLITAEGTTTVTYFAQDNLGNTEVAKTLVVKLDKTAPTIAAAPDRPADSNGWYNHPLTVTFSGTDATSGIASCTPPTPYGGPDTATGSLTGTCTDNAGNVGSATFAFKYDATPPAIGITSPTAGAIYTLNQLVTASYACTDATSGVAACTGTLANGASATSQVGPRTLTVNATDVAGNPRALSVTYTVQYAICVLYDQTKAVKRGAVIPIKLQLCDAGGADVSASTVIVHATGVVPLSAQPTGDLVDAGNANPDNDFRFDLTLGPTGGYIYNLATTPLATGIWQVNFTAGNDPIPHGVQFQVR